MAAGLVLAVLYYAFVVPHASYSAHRLAEAPDRQRQQSATTAAITAPMSAATSTDML